MIREQPQFANIWVYLSGSPLFALIVTLAAYQLGNLLYQKTNKHPVANPVAIAVVLIALVLYLIYMPYQKYFEGAQFVHFLLGTSTVTLAVPIYKGFSILKTRLIPLTIALVCGGVVSIASAVGIATFMGADATIIGALYPKSVTTPIAMGIAERLTVSPTLTAVFAVVTGIWGTISGSLFFTCSA